MFNKLKGNAAAAKEEMVGVAKNYLIENKDQIKEKIGKNEAIKKLLSNKEDALASVVKIAEFLYGFLPFPVKFVIKKNDFVEFATENIDFILEVLA